MKIWTKIWSERPYSLHLMSMVTEDTVFGFKKLFRESRISQGFVYWEKGTSSYFYEASELQKTVELLSERSLKSPKFLFGFLEEAFRRAVRLRKMSEKFKKMPLPKISSEKLVANIEKYSKEFHNFYSYATVAPIIGYQSDNPIYKKMDELIRRKTKYHPEKYSDYYTALTSPPKKLKTNLLEIEILKLAKKARQSKVKTEKALVSKYKKEIKDIQKNYKFLSFDFCDSLTWSFDHFENLVWDAMDSDIGARIGKLENIEKISRNDFEKAARELKLSKSEKEICNLVRYLGFQKWAREHEFQESQYNLKFIQDELGRRLGLTTLDSKYLLAEEYRKLLRNPRRYKKLTRDRIRNSLCLVQFGKGTNVFVGAAAEKKVAEMKKEESGKVSFVKTLKGMPAYPGKVLGKAKIIISAKEAKKMKKGDILVSQATSPALLPAMKLAAAIVTNEGGITAHAAIVSRELKIPCIVGTKIATKVLRDGDLVEVDANRGIIKKIKQ